MVRPQVGGGNGKQQMKTLVGEALNRAFDMLKKRPTNITPLPHPETAFMDDTYLWAENPDELQGAGRGESNRGNVSAAP